MNRTEVQKSMVRSCNTNLRFSYCFKKLFFTAILLMATIMVNSQSIGEQAEKVGNEAFSAAMIRNIFIIAGVILASFLFKSSSRKNENKG